MISSLLRQSFETRSFGDHPRLQMDVYRPQGWQPGMPPTPAVLFFYGGAWKKGSRSLYQPLGRALAAHGYAVFIPDYRLYPEARFADFMSDGAAALSWVEAFAGEFGGDTGNITLMGHSAGAHISALLCLDETWLAAENLAPGHVSKFIGMAGPYSANLHRAGSVADIFADEENPDRTRPIKLVGPDHEMPRTLLLHGTADKTVPWQNSQNLANALGEHGGSVETHFYDGIGHIALLLSLAPGLRWRAGTWGKVLQFLAD